MCNSRMYCVNEVNLGRDFSQVEIFKGPDMPWMYHIMRERVHHQVGQLVG